MKTRLLMAHGTEQFLAEVNEYTARSEYIKLLSPAAFKLLGKYRSIEASEKIWLLPVATQVIFFLLILEAEESEACTTQLDLC